MTWGGKRKGSGRKSGAQRRKLCITISAENYGYLEKQQKEGSKKSYVVDDALKIKREIDSNINFWCEYGAAAGGEE